MLSQKRYEACIYIIKGNYCIKFLPDFVFQDDYIKLSLFRSKYKF